MLALVKPEADGAARDALRQAIAERAAAAARQAQGMGALRRAAELKDTAETALARFDSHDRRVAACRAERVKEWAHNGGEQPSTELPPDLAADLVARDQAKAELVAATDAHHALEAEHIEHDAAVSQAQERVTLAIAAILVQRADAIGAELLTFKRRAWALEKDLGGLAVLWLRDGRGNRLATISPKALAALSAAEPSSTILASPVNDASKRWNNFASLLMHDADAEAPQ